jgi:hypothetical protein
MGNPLAWQLLLAAKQSSTVLRDNVAMKRLVRRGNRVTGVALADGWRSRRGSGWCSPLAGC